MSMHTCPDPSCTRQFIDQAALHEHAEAVHTFDDVRSMVSDAVRDKFSRSGNYDATPRVPSIWTWVRDLADDWVVFEYESDANSSLQRCSYSIVDDAVTLGDPVEVVRRTVYDPKPNGTPAEAVAS